MKITAIVAMSKNRVIGIKNEIPWYLQDDFKFFKKVTLNHHIIMGRKTFESIKKSLSQRTNIVITRNPKFNAYNVILANSLENSISIAKYNGETEVFIIGGGEIYKQSLSILDKIYLTEVDVEIKGDTFFPELNLEEWRVSDILKHSKDSKNNYDFSIKLYEKL